MSNIVLPKEVLYTEKNKNEGIIEIVGCYPGYGTTLGNALRRVLLSSLGGSAITSVKINGVSHEYTTVDGVLEDVVQIVLNLKRINIKSYSEEPVKLKLKKNGEGDVVIGDAEADPQIEIVDPKQKIATITDKDTELDMEFTVQNGIGYVAIENQDRGDDIELGSIAIDAVYTPIRRVNFEVENMRVGKRTDYEKVRLTIVTDGTITPEEAFYEAVDILSDQFNSLKKKSN